ncbi:MAG: hypothetical protein GEV03_02045 [Streptosporangiales bacterium]|nr:hypothetical protein [Streptosporangiales bacterium]
MQRSTRPRRLIATLAIGGALSLVAAACGGGGEGEEGGGGLIVGTTDTVNTLDPAKCYNYYCSNILFNVGETLVSYDPKTSELAPKLAAEMPEISDDGKTYTFKLRDGVTFHDGSEMTSEDVKFSLERANWMTHPEGAGFLLDGIESIETPDPLTAVIQLAEPDITFGSKLAYATATIVPSDKYPAPEEKLPADADPASYEEYVHEDLVGTGPYRIEDFRENQSITLAAYDKYWGTKPKSQNVLVQFFEKSSQMQAALQSGEIDVAFRHLTTEQRESLQGNENIKTVEGAGASIRYLVFNPRLKPIDDPNVRKAIAAAVDRQRIIDDVFGGAGEPLYTMVPPDFEGSEPAFQEAYQGKKPSDFVNGKVKLTLWYSTDHYGDTEPALAQTIARTLEESGSFDVTLKSTEWAQFSEEAYPGKSGQYPVFLLGWYPDYLDVDDYLAPFYHSTSSFLRMYDNPKMDQLIDEEISAEDPEAQSRLQTFGEIQQLAAEDVPTLPLFVETPYAFVQSNVQGVDGTMGPEQIFRYYLMSKASG